MMIRRYYLIAAVISLCLSGCSTIRKPSLPETPPTAGEYFPPKIILDQLPKPEDLQARLSMMRDRSDLGLEERSFDPCDFGVDRRSGCPTHRLGVLYFQLMCRESTGTIQSIPKVYPVARQNLRWSIGARSGVIRTDDNGYSQLRIITRNSVGPQRLIIRMGRQYMGVRMEDVSRLVLPHEWCRH